MRVGRSSQDRGGEPRAFPIRTDGEDESARALRRGTGDRACRIGYTLDHIRKRLTFLNKQGRLGEFRGSIACKLSLLTGKPSRRMCQIPKLPGRAE